MYAIMTNASGGKTFFQGTDLPEGAEEVSAEAYEAALAEARMRAASGDATVIPDVSSAQAKIQLRRAGLRDRVNETIAQADGEVQDWFTDARTWQRSNPNVVAIGKTLKLSSEKIDDLFREAAKIDA